MGRIRTVKPEMAKHELLFDLEQRTGAPVRFAWALLPTQCDKEGRFRWQPRVLKSDILPYDAVDFVVILDALVAVGMLVKYRVGGEWYGLIPTWKRHQVCNAREQASKIPALENADEVTSPMHAQDKACACTGVVLWGTGTGTGTGTGNWNRELEETGSKEMSINVDGDVESLDAPLSAAMACDKRTPETDHRVVRYSEADLETARVMYAKILDKFPHVREPKFPKWAETIRKMREVDMRAVHDIAETFMWANEHEFWQRNCLSPDSLRKHYDKIRAQMVRSTAPADAFERFYQSTQAGK